MTFAPDNAILKQLEPAVTMRMRTCFEAVSLRRGAVLQHTGTEIEWVWFPESALICLVAESLDGENVTGGMVGRHGVFGAFEACGSRLSYARAIVQIAGNVPASLAGQALPEDPADDPGLGLGTWH